MKMHGILVSAVLSAGVIGLSGEWAMAQSEEAARIMGQPVEKKEGVDANVAALEVRANNAFNSGQYAVALPMLKKLQEHYKDDGLKKRVIDEQIRVAMQNVALGEGAIPGGGVGVVGGAGFQELPEEVIPTAADLRNKHEPVKDGEVREFKTIKHLGNFEYDAEVGGNIPEDVMALRGKVVRLRGYMIPLDQSANITNFALVPSLFACCFGQPPSIQHTLVVKTPEGKSLSYFPDEIIVEGVLNVEEKKEDGFIISVFELQAQSVKPAGK